MKRLAAALVALTLLGAPEAVLAADPQPSRMVDSMLEQQFEQVEKGLNRFIDGMNPQTRTAILKNEQGEIDVKVILKTLKDSLKQAKDRFNPGSANAITETVGFLKNAKAFDKGLAKRPGLSGADMTWADLVPEIGKLAGAYGIEWAAEPEAWVVSRTSDKELQAAIQSTRKGAESMNKEVASLLKKDQTIDQGLRTTAASKIGGLGAAARHLEDAIKRRMDSVAAVTRVLAARTELAAFVDATPAVASAATASWSRTRASVDVIAKAYGVDRQE